MSLRLIDNAQNSFTLPREFMITDMGNPARRTKIRDRALIHGVIDAGDDQYMSREITIQGVLSGRTDAAFLAGWQNIKGWLSRPILRLYLLNDTRFLYVQKIRNIKEQYEEGLFFRYGRLECDVLCIDPFIYEAAESQDVTVVSTSPQAFNVKAGGGIDAYPVISVFTNVQDDDLTLKNITDSNRQFRYADTFFDTNDTVIIDSREGTVQRGSTNTIANFSGSFLRLVPGDNEFEYTGAGDCTITITWRNRYL